MSLHVDTYKPKNKALLYKRKYKDTDSVSIEDLKHAYFIAANLVKKDKQYLPIFQRLDSELKKMQNEQSAFDKALAVAQQSQYLEM